MNNPILMVKDAGHGTTPEAAYKPGDVVKWRRMGSGPYIVAVAVPPRFPAEYALADLTGTARPLMITEPSRAIQYILVRENDPKPYLAMESNLKPTGEHIEIGSVLYGADA